MAFLDTPKILDKYRDKGLLWGVEPNSFIKKLPLLLKPCLTLDVGIGEGRNALFLAKQGFVVEGVDISKDAVNKCMVPANKLGLPIKCFIEDIMNFKFTKKYGLIISVATLHLVKKDKVLEVIRRIKDNTTNGGINLITVFTDADEGESKYPNLYFFAPNELSNLYSDWDILECGNYTKEENHGSPHTHHFSAIIARK